MHSVSGRLASAALIVFAVISLSACVAEERDDFGKRHPIPQGLEYAVPLDEDAEHVPSGMPELVIRNGQQGGIYSYEFYSPPMPDGEIFLKCFEATENIPLSVRSVRSRTIQKIGGHVAFGAAGERRSFTVYEGDWGEPYAVRVEVWHRRGRGSLHKLHEAVYKMEGWQR